MQSKLVDINSLVQNPKNPQIYTSVDIDKLCNLIKDDNKQGLHYFDARPVIVSNRTGQNIIIAGNKRWQAAKQAGLKEIPCVIMQDLTEEQETKIIFQDNSSFGEWDTQAIIENGWADLPLEEWGVKINWSEEEIESNNETVGDDEVPTEPAKPFVVRNDIFEIQANNNTYRIGCLDSTSEKDIEKLMNGNKADMVFTDPPYNASFNGRGGKFEVFENDNLSKKDFFDFIKSIVSILELQNVKEQYICCDWRMYINVGELFEHKQLIVWNKDIPCMGTGYRNKHEFILYKGDFKSKIEVNVWDEVAIQSGASKDDDNKGWFNGGNIQLRLHPTQKPIIIPTRAITNSSLENQNILDLFCGSGSTLIACIKTKRSCFTNDISENYVQVAVKRAVEFMNKNNIAFTITLNGATFDTEKLN